MLSYHRQLSYREWPPQIAAAVNPWRHSRPLFRARRVFRVYGGLVPRIPLKQQHTRQQTIRNDKRRRFCNLSGPVVADGEECRPDRERRPAFRNRSRTSPSRHLEQAFSRRLGRPDGLFGVPIMVLLPSPGTEIKSSGLLSARADPDDEPRRSACPRPLFFCKSRYSGQLDAGKELERSSSSRRDVGDFIGNARGLDCLFRIPASYH